MHTHTRTYACVYTMHTQVGVHTHTCRHAHSCTRTHSCTQHVWSCTDVTQACTLTRIHAYLLHFRRWLLENVSFPGSGGWSSPTAVLTGGRRSWRNRPCLPSQAAGAGASLTPLWEPSAHLAPSVGVSGPTSTGRLRPSCLARPAQPFGCGLSSAFSPLPAPSPAWSCNVGTSVVDLSELSLKFSA